ncbi:MAG: hypothetical protein V3U65_00415 [Granulosicoccaceae bacterium]
MNNNSQNMGYTYFQLMLSMFQLRLFCISAFIGQLGLLDRYQLESHPHRFLPGA